MALRLVAFLAVILTALVPAGGHLLAMPNKMAMSQADYFVAQGIYRGWALAGAFLVAALLADLAFAVVLWRGGRPFFLPLLAALVIVATLAIFFAWTFPANQQTADWATVPADWETLRRQWEVSHAVNAGLLFLALCLTAWAALLPWRIAAAPAVGS